MARLEAFAALPPGWLDGEGATCDVSALLDLGQAFERYYDPILPPPHLYPALEGAVQAEWSFGNWEISLLIDLGRNQGQYQALHVRTGRLSEMAFDLGAGEPEWERLNRELRSAQETMG